MHLLSLLPAKLVGMLLPQSFPLSRPLERPGRRMKGHNTLLEFPKEYIVRISLPLLSEEDAFCNFILAAKTSSSLSSPRTSEYDCSEKARASCGLQSSQHYLFGKCLHTSRNRKLSEHCCIKWQWVPFSIVAIATLVSPRKFYRTPIGGAPISKRQHDQRETANCCDKKCACSHVQKIKTSDREIKNRHSLKKR